MQQMTTYQQFQEGISSDEIEEKLKFVKQTTQVAKELGKAETISSLLPFLHGTFFGSTVESRLVSGQ